MAANWGRLFHTDPFTLLDRGVDEMDIALAIYEAAINRITAERE